MNTPYIEEVLSVIDGLTAHELRVVAIRALQLLLKKEPTSTSGAEAALNCLGVEPR